MALWCFRSGSGLGINTIQVVTTTVFLCDAALMLHERLAVQLEEVPHRLQADEVRMLGVKLCSPGEAYKHMIWDLKMGVGNIMIRMDGSLWNAQYSWD
jgi:hypothetical protein